MKASEFLKKYEREQQTRKEDAEEHSLQSHAKERAKHPDHLNAGTPYDWEDLESYRKELERMEREGPGGSRGDPKKG